MQIILINGRLTRSRSHFVGKNIVARSSFRCNDQQLSMLGTVFVLHLLQQHLLILSTIGIFVFRMNIHLLVPSHKWLQVPESVNEICRNENHTGGWSNFIPVFGKLLSCKLDGIVSVSLHWVFFLAMDRKRPFIWSNMSLYRVIILYRVAICRFDIDRVQYQNSLDTSITYLSTVYSSWVVKSGR